MIKLFDLVCGDRCLSYIGNTSDEFVVACCSKDEQWDVVLHVSKSRSEQFWSITRALAYYLAYNDHNQIVFTNGCVGCIVDSMEVRRRDALKGIPVMLPESLIMTEVNPKILQFTDLFGSRQGLSLSGYHMGAQSWAVFECRGNPVYVQMATANLAQLLDVLDALPDDHTAEFTVDAEPQQLYMSVYDATETEVSPERAFDFIHMDIIAPNVPLQPGQLYMARGISKERNQFAILTDCGETMVFSQDALRGVYYPNEHVLGKRYIVSAGLHLVPMSVGHDGDTVSPSDCDIVFVNWPTFLTEPGIQFPSKLHQKEDVMTKTEPAGQAYEFATPTKEPVTTLPLYQCHKEVRASKILEIDPRIQEISQAETPKYTTYTVVTEHGSVELRFEEACRLAKVLVVGSYLVAYKPAGERNPIALEKAVMKLVDAYLEHIQEPFRRDAMATLTKRIVVKHNEICNDISYWYKSVSPATEFEAGYSAK